MLQNVTNSSLTGYIGTDGTYPHYQNLTNHQYNAPQHAAAHTQQFAPSFGNSRQQYGDLGRETREAERLAVQFRQLGVDSDEQDSFAASNRNAYPAFPQTQINNSLPATFSSQSQQQYVDYQNYQSRQTLPGGVPLWGGNEETSFSGETYAGENTYAEGYGDQQAMIYSHKPGMISSAELQNRNQTSQIYSHGESSQRSVEPQAQVRIGTTVWSPSPRRIPQACLNVRLKSFTDKNRALDKFNYVTSLSHALHIVYHINIPPSITFGCPRIPSIMQLQWAS